MQIGQKIIQLITVDSTNNYVAKLNNAGDIEHGTVILAEHQTLGRGQRGATWQSEPGKNLTFSIFLTEVNLSVNSQFRLTQFISLVIIQFLQEKGIKAKIKWPNDIYVGNRKIAGILIESSVKGEFINEATIGIGLNVNQKDLGILHATSMASETGVNYNLSDLLLSVIYAFNELASVHNLSSEQIDLKYDTLLYGREEEMKFSDQNGYFSGIIQGVDSIGRLKIQKGDNIQKYSLKEISFIN